jgi:hypothetical protein
MDKERRSEKRGWTLGWSGGFVWVLVLAVLEFIQGSFFSALLNCALIGIALALILTLAPWRYPAQPYWKLMIPIYILFFGAIGFLLVPSSSLMQIRLGPWSIFMLLPLLLPFFLAGRRRWVDNEKKEGVAQHDEK